jgi:hypothetical protein
MKNLDNIAIKVTYDGEGKEIVNYLESLGYNRGHLILKESILSQKKNIINFLNG